MLVFDLKLKRSLSYLSNRFVIYLCLLALGGLFAQSATAVSYRAIALKGQTIPLDPENSTYTDFLTRPRLNDRGEIYFSAYNMGGLGIYSPTTGFAIRTSDSISGIEEGVTIGSLHHGLSANNFDFNNADQVSLRARLDGTNVDGSNDSAVFVVSNNTPRLIAREGDTAPGTSIGVKLGDPDPFSEGDVYDFDPSFSDTTLNDQGEVAFYAKLSGFGVNETNNYGLYVESGGTPNLIYREGGFLLNGGEILIFGNGETTPEFESVIPSTFRFSLNNAGGVAFSERLTVFGATGSTESGLFYSSGGAIDLIAKTGDTHSGLEDGTTLDLIRNLALNDAGNISFRSSLTGTDVDHFNDNNSAIFSKTSDGISLIAREGEPAPGAGPDRFYGDMREVEINNQGTTLFSTRITGPNIVSPDTSGIFTESNGVVDLLLLTGDAVPGENPDVIFSSFSQIQFNNQGQFAFFATTFDPNIDANYDDPYRHGIYATDTEGNLNLIAREGLELDVNQDPLVTDNRTIDYTPLSFSFNDAGQVGLNLEFTDHSSGIFVANTAVPEPASIFLIAMGVLTLLNQRKM